MSYGIVSLSILGPNWRLFFSRVSRSSFAGIRRINANVFASACFTAIAEVDFDEDEQFVAPVMRDHIPGGKAGLVTIAGSVPDCRIAAWMIGFFGRDNRL